MRVEMSYEGDSRWEQHESIFRVYFFDRPGPTYSYGVITFDVADATFSEAMMWAEKEARDRMYSIALVSSNEQGERGLVWLIGDDANDVLDPASTHRSHAIQVRMRKEMEQSRLRRV